MRPVFLFASALLTSVAFAQAPEPARATMVPGQVIVLQAGGSQNCPVQLSARHSRDTGLVKVSPRSEPRGQGYSITFKPLSWRSVESARITLHGLAGAQVMPVQDQGKFKDKSKSDATEKFTVSPSREPDHLFQSVVYAHKLTGVQWIELNELTFADGSTWHESPDSICRVAPNGFMLVGAH